MVRFRPHFDQAVDEGAQPENPFEEGCKHQWADD